MSNILNISTTLFFRPASFTGPWAHHAVQTPTGISHPLPLLLKSTMAVASSRHVAVMIMATNLFPVTMTATLTVDAVVMITTMSLTTFMARPGAVTPLTAPASCPRLLLAAALKSAVIVSCHVSNPTISPLTHPPQKTASRT